MHSEPVLLPAVAKTQTALLLLWSLHSQLRGAWALFSPELHEQDPGTA